MQRGRTDNPTAVSVDAAFSAPMELARRAAAVHHPHPNPRVGAVIVTNEGEVLGTGAHVMAGEPHAEINALASAATEVADGATMFVTLEPCAHHGRTPPCADAVIDAGIATVHVGALDPDPRVSGQGVARMREAGLEVVVAEDQTINEAVDPAYFHHRRTGLPLVTLKMASTLDGQIGAADGTSQWITSPEARQDVHTLRSRSDGIMVGAGTVLTDAPRLDVRLDGYSGHQPIPVVIQGQRDLPKTAPLWERDALVYRGADTDGVVDLSLVLKDLGTKGMLDVLVEGGPKLAAALMSAGLVDKIVWYVGAKLAGGTGLPAMGGVFATIGDATEITIESVTAIGPDLRIDATPAEEC